VKVVTHTRLVARRRHEAMAASIGGLAVLGVGLLISLTRVQLVAYAYGALVVGSVLSWIGIWLSETWLRPPRADEALAQALKGAGPAYALYNWVLPADHVLLVPWGLVVIAALGNDGPALIDGARWREQRPLRQRVARLGRRPLRNPSRWLGFEVRSLRDALSAAGAELGDVPIQPLAVFVQPKAVISVGESELPVIRADGFRTWLRQQKVPSLSPARRRQLVAALDELAASRRPTITTSA
jgi:hypothetical protein